MITESGKYNEKACSIPCDDRPSLWLSQASSSSSEPVEVEHPAIGQVLLEAVTLWPPAADVLWMLCRYANKHENNAKSAKLYLSHWFVEYEGLLLYITWKTKLLYLKLKLSQFYKEAINFTIALLKPTVESEVVPIAFLFGQTLLLLLLLLLLLFSFYGLILNVLVLLTITYATTRALIVRYMCLEGSM